jgi:hypothetical protein
MEIQEIIDKMYEIEANDEIDALEAWTELKDWLAEKQNESLAATTEDV